MIGNLCVLLYFLLYCFKYKFEKDYKHTVLNLTDENYAIAKVKRKYPCKSL